MNWMYKLEQKYGRYAIYDLHKYFVITYLIGFALNYIGGGAILEYLSFDMNAILAGQIWRLVTWILCVYRGGGIFVYTEVAASLGLFLCFAFCLWDRAYSTF